MRAGCGFGKRHAVGLEPKNAVPVALIAPYAGMAELTRKLGK